MEAEGTADTSGSGQVVGIVVVAARMTHTRVLQMVEAADMGSAALKAMTLDLVDRVATAAAASMNSRLCSVSAA